MSERECDRAVARPSTVQKGIIAPQKTKINPDRSSKVCRGYSLFPSINQKVIFFGFFNCILFLTYRAVKFYMSKFHITLWRRKTSLRLDKDLRPVDAQIPICSLRPQTVKLPVREVWPPSGREVPRYEAVGARRAYKTRNTFCLHTNFASFSPSADGIAFSSGSEGLILQAKLRMRCPRPQTARLALWESSAAGGERESRLPLERGNGQLFSLPKRKKLAKKKLATLQVDRLRPSIVSLWLFLLPRVLCLRWRLHLHPKQRGWKPSVHERAASI